MRRTMLCVGVVAAIAASASGQNRYVDTILVANDASYSPLVLVDPLVSNAWGITLRPPGAGGHFWISNFNTGTTTTYVGDVRGPGGFTPLFQDALKVVDIAVGAGQRLGRPVAPIPQITGQVYNYSNTDFVVSGEGITNASRFIFVTAEGTISGWTEIRDQNNNLLRQTRSVITVDTSDQFDDERLRYTGIAITDFPSGNRIYVTNTEQDRVEIFDHLWQPVATQPSAFRYPLSGGNGDFRPWNIQYYRTGPNGEGRLWVSYIIPEEPWEEYPDFGAVAEFDLDGNFIRRLTQPLDTDPVVDSILRSPWGVAIAPANFGPFSNMMLVANFGDGTIAAFDLTTNHFVDFLRDNAGQPLIVDGIWGHAFGNGVALGDSNALYYAAGPNGEVDGTFGTVRWIPDTCAIIAQQPTTTTVCPGDQAAFSVGAPSPVRLTPRWQREVAPGQWQDLADGALPGVGTIAGAAATTLSVAGAQDDTRFRCVLSNSCGETFSTLAVLNVGLIGDANNDNAVNFADITSVLNGFNNVGDPFFSGDANGDGAVNFADITTVLNAFNNACI